MQCPDEIQISMFIDGELDEADRAQLERHLQACPSCAATRDQFLNVGRALTPTSAPPSESARRRALERVLSQGRAPLWSRTVAVPAPVLASLVLVIPVAGVLAVKSMRQPDVRPPVPATSAVPAAGPDLPLARFDRGRRPVVYVVRRDERTDGKGKETPR